MEIEQAQQEGPPSMLQASLQGERESHRGRGFWVYSCSEVRKAEKVAGGGGERHQRRGRSVDPVITGAE